LCFQINIQIKSGRGFADRYFACVRDSYRPNRTSEEVSKEVGEILWYEINNQSTLSTEAERDQFIHKFLKHVSGSCRSQSDYIGEFFNLQHFLVLIIRNKSSLKLLKAAIEVCNVLYETNTVGDEKFQSPWIEAVLNRCESQLVTILATQQLPSEDLANELATLKDILTIVIQSGNLYETMVQSSSQLAEHVGNLLTVLSQSPNTLREGTNTTPALDYQQQCLQALHTIHSYLLLPGLEKTRSYIQSVPSWEILFGVKESIVIDNYHTYLQEKTSSNNTSNTLIPPPPLPTSFTVFSDMTGSIAAVPITEAVTPASTPSAPPLNAWIHYVTNHRTAVLPILTRKAKSLGNLYLEVYNHMCDMETIVDVQCQHLVAQSKSIFFIIIL
jgi:hypothetical protein